MSSPVAIELWALHGVSANPLVRLVSIGQLAEHSRKLACVKKEVRQPLGGSVLLAPADGSACAGISAARHRQSAYAAANT
jgi:hypothetical protein